MDGPLRQYTIDAAPLDSEPDFRLSVLAPNGFQGRNRQHSEVTVLGAWEGEAPAEPREGVTSESLQSQGEIPFGASTRSTPTGSTTVRRFRP